MTRLLTFATACAFSALTLAGSLAQTAPAPAGQATSSGPAEYTPQSGQAGKDVVWVPTLEGLVERMLDMARVTKDDFVIDLGSGDGRTVIAAAKRGARAHGIEYNPELVALSRRNAEAERVADRATFEAADIFQSDFSKASVVTMFLLPGLNLRLRPILLDMKPGTRIVSNTFSMAEWTPDETAEAGASCTTFCRAFKWIIPAKVGGIWRLGNGELNLTQTFQMLTGTLTQDGSTMPITQGSLNGAQIFFTAGGQRYTGEVTGATMKGQAEDGKSWAATRSGS